MKPIKIPDGPLKDGVYMWGYKSEFDTGCASTIIVTCGQAFFVLQNGKKDYTTNDGWDLEKAILYKLSVKSYYHSL